MRLFLVVPFLSAALVAGVGCQHTVTSTAPRGDILRPGDLPAGPNGYSPDQLTSADRCPSRLHDIAGALLLYYAVHKDLPKKLDELNTVSDSPLEFTCPDSGRPYVYTPAGLRAPGKNKRIILHDPTPSPNGTRWCILVSDEHRGGPQDLEVVQLPEPFFLTYQ